MLTRLLGESMAGPLDVAVVEAATYSKNGPPRQGRGQGREPEHGCEGTAKSKSKRKRQGQGCRQRPERQRQGQGREIPEQGGRRAEFKRQRTRSWRRQFKRPWQSVGLANVFVEFIKGLSWHELGRSFSFRDEEVANMYVYYPGSERAERPLNPELNWPVNFLCSKHSRKHAFEPNLRPSLRGIAQPLEQWEHKLRWRLTFRTPNVTRGGASTEDANANLRDRF